VFQIAISGIKRLGNSLYQMLIKKIISLLDEKFEIEQKILDDLITLIDASWDLDTVKLRIYNVEVKLCDKCCDSLK